jgi:hypothetical protein
MSKISKILLIASVVFFLLSHAAHRLRYEYLLGHIPVESREEWMAMWAHNNAMGYDNWDIFVFIIFASSLVCVLCAILLWRRDRTGKPQKLFLE